MTGRRPDSSTVNGVNTSGPAGSRPSAWAERYDERRSSPRGYVHVMLDNEREHVLTSDQAERLASQLTAAAKEARSYG